MVKEIKLSQGKVALVDDGDFELVSKYKWCAQKAKNENYYAKTNEPCMGKQKPIMMHRIIMNANKGDYVDHINHNGLDNRRCNLRICSQTENMRNKKLHSNNTSGYKGVYWGVKEKKWVAQIKNDQKVIWLGSFKNIIDAASAYNQAAIKYHGEFAKLNDLTIKE